MSMHPLLTGGRGERHLLLTNEAIVRGALEAGVSLVSCYPGTPSSEVPDTFRKLGSDRYVLEYSVNEKVAFEVAAGAALAGGMALVTMKHVGLNVAADPLFTAAYSGLPGGLVLLSADDPGCHASQNEQDNRHYARAASLPCFEPASAAEAREMTREAFRMARELQQPIMLRTTTRVNHMRGPVEFGDLPAERSQVPFERNPGRFVAVPATARVRHRALVTAMKKAREFAENSRFNTEHGDPGVRTGIIVSGVSRNYLADALATGGWGGRVRVLELGMTWPLPEKKLLTFLSSCDRVLVLEEGDPLLESGVRELAQRHHCAVRVEGKDDLLTVQGEYSTTLLLRRLAQYLDCPCPALTSAAPAAEGLPNRPPNLCAGCSHRAVYYAVRQVFGDDAYYSNDIGCYTLGVLPPLRAADFLVCMGSSISTGSGFARVSGKPVVAFIGDSTFFHSGMTGLANALFNRHDLLVVILDNGTTAMTGHQPNPGMAQEVLGEASLHLDIEAVVRGLGVTQFARVKAFNLKGVMAALEELKDKKGVRVLLAEEPCALYARRQFKKGTTQVAEVREQGEDAQRCLDTLACPAFYRDGENIAVDENLCSGCMVCLQVAPKAFKARKRG